MSDSIHYGVDQKGTIVIRDICWKCKGHGWVRDRKTRRPTTCPRCGGLVTTDLNEGKTLSRVIGWILVALVLFLCAWAFVEAVEEVAQAEETPSYLTSRMKERAGIQDPEPEPESEEQNPVRAEPVRAKTLEEILDRPEILEALGRTPEGQTIAHYIRTICPSAPEENVILVSQEWVRWRILYPQHPSVTQWKRWMKLIRGECGFRPPCITPPYGASGLLQFLPSTCQWFPTDLSRLRSPKPEDIRYQYRQGCRLLGSKEGGWWSQWAADPGPQ